MNLHCSLKSDISWWSGNHGGHNIQSHFIRSYFTMTHERTLKSTANDCKLYFHLAVIKSVVNSCGQAGRFLIIPSVYICKLCVPMCVCDLFSFKLKLIIRWKIFCCLQETIFSTTSKTADWSWVLWARGEGNCNGFGGTAEILFQSWLQCLEDCA